MAPVFSKLQKQQFAAAYARNRPLIQRILNTAFALWMVGGTYVSLTASKGKGAESGRGKRGKSKGDEKYALSCSSLCKNRMYQLTLL